MKITPGVPSVKQRQNSRDGVAMFFVLFFLRVSLECVFLNVALFEEVFFNGYWGKHLVLVTSHLVIS